MSLSQRAAASVVQPMKVNESDRDQLRELWRLAAIEAAKADDRAQRAKEGKSIFFDALVDTLIQQNEGLSATKAERMARTSKAFKDYVDEMHDLRLKARLAEIEEKNRDRIYWEQVSSEARERQEMRMTR